MRGMSFFPVNICLSLSLSLLPLLIPTFASRSDPARAQSALAEMRTEGYQPHLQTFLALLQSARDVETAQHYTELMQVSYFAVAFYEGVKGLTLSHERYKKGYSSV